MAVAGGGGGGEGGGGGREGLRRGGKWESYQISMLHPPSLWGKR